MKSPFADGFDSDDADELAAHLKAVANPARLLLLSELHRHEAATVSELVDLLGYLTQPTVSHHLGILSGAGLVTASKEGSFHIYRLAPDALKRLGKTLGGIR